MRERLKGQARRLLGQTRSAGQSPPLTDLRHGTRSRYQQLGCRCTPCRAAEASYRAALRLRRAKGLPVLGQSISPSEAWARVRALRQEQFTDRQITGWARAKHGIAFTATSRVRVRTLLRMRSLCRAYLIDEADLPNHHPVDLPPPEGNI